MTTRFCPQCRFDNSDTARFCANCGAPMTDPGEDLTATIDLPGARLASGTLFAGRYLIIEELGRGGMGRVYRAIDKLIDDEIALKLIRPEIAAEKRTLERFSHELKTARKIVHKNVGRMYDLAEDRGNHFITMEYVPGQDLKGLIRQTGRLTISKALFLAKQICQGLGEAHRLGIVHRDLKPGNIMIDREGNARIMDFGIALSFTGDESRRVSGWVGTPDYMSPEQVEGQEVDQRSDIYALGILLFEMMTGRRPFADETPVTIALKQKNELPPDPRGLNPLIPDPLARVILRCLEKDRDKRFPGVEALLAELERVELGLSDEERSERKKSVKAGGLKLRTRWPFRIAALLILLAVAAAIVIMRSRGGTIDSIAVLPFETAAAGPDTDYLSEGITENIINRLTLLPSLKKVIALSSVFRYKGKTVDPQAAGRELGVDAVLVSRLTRRGEEILISVELMRVRDNSRIWGRQYPFQVTDVFTVQEQIANSITEELRLNLTGEERRRMARSYTGNYEAFYAYSQGRYFWNKRTVADLQRAIAHFERAIQLDPNYALAYAGLSQSYSILPDYGSFPPNQAYPKAKEYALKALQIDDKLAQARLALAQIYRRYEWNWTAAEVEFKLALEYDPNDAMTHHWYGYDLMCVGRYDEAIKEIRRARELDPYSLVINRNLGQALFRAKRFDEAMEILKRTLETDPNFSYLHFYIGKIYLSTERYQEALQEFQNEKQISRGWGQEVDAWIGVVYFKLGQRDKTQEILDRLLEQQKQNFVSPTLVALLYFQLGRNDEGFRMLDKAYEEHDSQARQIRMDASFDSVRADPRFAVILKKMGMDR
jgi:serine/threonine protein kinase/tetratricopeptide (TPR) repeat protein